MTTNVRVVGSGFSTFSYGGQPLAWLDAMTDSGQTVMGGNQGFEVVTPLGSRYAQEIVTGRVLNPGTLTCTVRELWNAPAWWQLQGLAGTTDLADVFAAMAASSVPITCNYIISPPGASTVRGWVYNNCTVVHIDDTESLQIGSLSVARQFVVLYTYKTQITGPVVTPTS